MAARLEISLKEHLVDPEGEGIRKKAKAYFGIETGRIRTVHILTIDAALSADQLEAVRSEVFTNPVTQTSSYRPLPIAADWVIWVGYRPGVRDNPGATAVEAIEDLLGLRLGAGEAVYTSRRYAVSGGGLTRGQLETIGGELLANDIIQQWRVFSREEWDPAVGVGVIIPRVRLDHPAAVAQIPCDSDEALGRISRERNLALNPNDIPVIRAYFSNPRVRASRAALGLSDPTDVELEYISQARSDHCNHNTFRGRFRYRDAGAGTSETVDNLFKTCIEAPTLELARQKPWVVSVLWDNAGAGRLDDDTYYVITGETHNSPSNMEAYGGAITGIVGVYRDPLGTGKGSKLVMGGWGFCVGHRDYAGPLKPRLHPRRTAVGIMPARILGQPAEEKRTRPGDLVVMCGGRVGKDGIHGVTASSEVFSAHTPAGHVQIGDPYTQKKMHDFLLEARDEGLIRYITDNGGGGLSSSVGESARFSNGAEVDLARVPLKYEGLDPWEIWVSESQERMTVAIRPEDAERFMALSRRHAVESTVIGRYTDSGKLHLTHAGKTCAWVDMDFLASGFPQWEFDAEWSPPEQRGRVEPVLSPPADMTRLLSDMLARPNICSTEWITRQYDHEVQGGSVIKPLVGADRDLPSDAAVLRPVLGSRRGLAFAQALLPAYSAIDAHAMSACSIDEAVRRVLAVGGDIDHIGGVDNFCWPNIQYHPASNPDGKFKAAQLVRACRALREVCIAYGIPLLSGKDSMYVDGHLAGRYGETHKVSARETMQFAAISVVPDIGRCTSMEVKEPGDRLYVIGVTRNELGGSEYYAHHGYVGLNVPQVRAAEFMTAYRALGRAVAAGLPASVHGIYRGGLGVHLALAAMGGNLGVRADLRHVPAEGAERVDALLFSESPGRFIVTVAPALQPEFESLFSG
nr:AIR synthase-related protein [Desulfobacterales bacterium]